MKQIDLRFRRHGGKRKGAGRPRGQRVSHSARLQFARVRARGRAFRRIAACFARARGRFGMRLVEYSVQGNHLHLIVEAESSESLSRGMQGLSIRIVRALNAMMRSAGKVIGDHYHARLLRSPTELVRAIAYVLGNSAHHFGEQGIDPFSSAALPPANRSELLASPCGWLLNVGRRLTAPSG